MLPQVALRQVVLRPGQQLVEPRAIVGRQGKEQAIALSFGSGNFARIAGEMCIRDRIIYSNPSPTPARDEVTGYFHAVTQTPERPPRRPTVGNASRVYAKRAVEWRSVT